MFNDILGNTYSTEDLMARINALCDLLLDKQVITKADLDIYMSQESLEQARQTNREKRNNSLEEILKEHGIDQNQEKKGEPNER